MAVALRQRPIDIDLERRLTVPFDRNERVDASPLHSLLDRLLHRILITGKLARKANRHFAVSMVHRFEVDLHPKSGDGTLSLSETGHTRHHGSHIRYPILIHFASGDKWKSLRPAFSHTYCVSSTVIS